MAIPFYGAQDRELFAIERRAMDRPGYVIEALRARLPERGLVLDVGAGDGYTAELLTTPTRLVVAAEPASGMWNPERRLPWVGAVAQELPLREASCDAAYSTWAYFFTGPGWDPTPGIAELDRVVRPGGTLLVVDNLGDDEFSALAGDRAITASVEQWASYGFACTVVDTAFEFDNHDEARALLSLYFGAIDDPPLRISYRVGLFSRPR